MNVSLYQAAASMNAQARWQELITENLSTGSVPGYRKHDISFAAVEAGLPSSALNAAHSHNVIPAARSGVNFTQGELRSTGNSMDFALEGDGFFEVQLPNGAKAYTRDGEFHVNPAGQLVTKQGYNIVADSNPLQFDPNNGGAITISPDGHVSQGGDAKGTIRLVEFKNPQDLTPITSGYFLNEKPGVMAESASATSIRQGFLENSNTSPTIEMGNLITSMRMFEASQRVLQMQDERMGKVITELGNPS